MSLPNKVTVVPNLLCQELNGEMAILDMNQEHYFSLNTVGARMWELLSGGRSPSETVDLITKEFDVPKSNVENDLANLLEALLSANLVKVHS